MTSARKWMCAAITVVTLGGLAGAPTQAAAFPDVIPLPIGFAPEGIVVGAGPTAYAGSLSSGDIVEVDLVTGAVETLATGPGAASTVGLAYDARTDSIFVAGGLSGGARVVDATTGALVTAYSFGGGFINDVVVTRDAAYFTDSFAPFMYRVELGAGGTPSGAFEPVPLTGLTFIPGTFNANGIVATPDGSTLIVVNGSSEELFAVDPTTGDSTPIDLGGDAVPNGDGLVLVGPKLYVVQNFLNQIAEFRLSPDLTSAERVDTITDPDFDIPTTADVFGRSLYAVNARFDVAPPGSNPPIEFDIVRVDR